MFKEKVNSWTDARTTDNGPRHKLAGLWPVELKIGMCIKSPLSRLERQIENRGKVHRSNIPRSSYMKFHPIWSRGWGENGFGQTDGQTDGQTEEAATTCSPFRE